MDRAEGTTGMDLLAAVRAHPLAFAAPIVVLTLVLAVYGLVRPAQYTAEARISVGRLDVSTQGLPGFAQAGTSLAAAFARAVDAPPVTAVAAREARVSPGAAADALSASPIPQSPLIRVEAETADASSAVALANGGARGLIDYSRDVGGSATADAQLARFVELSREVRHRAIRLAEARARYRAAPTPARRAALEAADGRLAAAQLQRDAARQAYGLHASGQSAASLLSMLAPATEATSDRSDVLKRLVATGLIAGLVVGLGLAAWQARAPRRRTPSLRAAA